MMSDRYASKEDLAAKVDWEAIIGYGIYADELPEGTPAEIVQAWTAVQQVRVEVGAIYEWLES